MLKVETDARRTFVRLWLALGLDHDRDLDPRPEGGSSFDPLPAMLRFRPRLVDLDARVALLLLAILVAIVAAFGA